jgi:hypothetical protein
MANARGEKDYLNLVKGLNTETNPLAFPEGYTSDELNFLLSLDGDVRLRRKGLANLLSDMTYTSVSGENLNKPFMHYWDKEDILLVIIQEENEDVILQVRDALDSYNLLGSYTMYNGVTLISKPSFSSIIDGVVITTSDTDGGLVPIIVKANSAGNIEISEISLHFRDFELLDDGVSVSERFGNVTNNHTYNLYNAGWYAERKNATGDLVPPLSLFTSGSKLVEPSTFDADSTTNIFTLNFSYPTTLPLGVGENFTLLGTASGTNDGAYTVVNINDIDLDTTEIEVASIPANETGSVSVQLTYGTGQYPSNADIPYLGLKENGSGELYFSPSKLFETVLGNTEAPRGHYVYNVYGSTDARDEKLSDKDADGTPATTVTLKATITR